MPRFVLPKVDYVLVTSVQNCAGVDLKYAGKACCEAEREPVQEADFPDMFSASYAGYPQVMEYNGAVGSMDCERLRFFIEKERCICHKSASEI